MPRNKEISSHFAFPNSKGYRINIDFTTPVGYKIMMSVPSNEKIGDILLEYISVVGLGPDVLGKGIYFLYNGQKIKKVDEKKTAQELGMNDFSHIVVIDVQNLIGA